MDTHPALAVSVDDLLKHLASARRISGFWKAGSIGKPVSCDLASGRVGDTRKLAFHPVVERDQITRRSFQRSYPSANGGRTRMALG